MYRFAVVGEWQAGVAVGQQIGYGERSGQKSLSTRNRTMNGFPIDFALEMPYPLAPPQGWEVDLIFEKKQMAISNWHLAKANP